MNKTTTCSLACTLLLLVAGCGSDEHHAGTKGPTGTAPAGKTAVMFLFPQDSSKVYETFDVVPMVVWAGQPKTGKFRVIVDGVPAPSGQSVDATHPGIDKPEGHARLKLTPGRHKVTAQFVDDRDASYGPELASTIEVEVVAAPPKKGVFFKNLQDGAKISQEQKIEFGLMGMELVPAGQDTADKTKGHHHLLINHGPDPVGKVVPTDDTHLHFGKAQTETVLKLAPGKYKLTLQFADGNHASYGPDMAASINVEVQ